MRLFALADCNNFYCSCERVFQPSLRGVPMVVLSNNDGCVIARSEEAKAVGIKMGAPAFQMRPLIIKNGVRVFSSNYTLYGDMSARVMQILASEAPKTEVYSIDECFLDLQGVKEPERHAINLRSKVRQWTGLPISIGLGSTKVLAKAANKLAKQTPAGVLRITDENRDALLARFPVEKVWGIGRQLSRRLQARQIHTALDLLQAPHRWVRQQMGVVGERVVLELNGIACADLETEEPRKNLCCAKSFGHPLSTWEEIAEALACYTNRVCEKLRAQGSLAAAIQVFIMTNPHRPDQPQYSAQRTMTLPEPTAYAPALISHALLLLKKIHRPGFLYRKVGILLLDLCEAEQRDLFAPIAHAAAKERLQLAVDSLEGKVRWGAMGLEEAWKLRAEHKTPCYTTDRNDLPLARAV
jgi:DNA polymerase V